LKRVKRILRPFSFILILVLFSALIILPFVFGFIATIRVRPEVKESPEGFQNITLTTSDRLELEAWYRKPQNGSVIILVHGSGNSRENIRPYAELLAKHKFGVLAFDMRGHGKSEGKTNRYGWENTRDVEAAVQFLKGESDVKSIGALGLSLGGETILGSADSNPDIKAIVSEGATLRSFNDLYDLKSERPIYRNFTARIMFFSVKLFTGQQPPQTIVESMRKSKNTRFLLIAGGKEKLEISYNNMFANTAGERAQLWIAKDTGHTGALHKYPEEYEQKIVGFFSSELL